MKKIQEVDFEGKNVLVRVDFNVAVEDGKVRESFKIEAAKKTMNYILENGGKPAMITHLGRPEGKKDSTYSLRPIVNDLEKILGNKINFVDDCIGEKVDNALDNLQKGDILLLENVRFYAQEEENEENFSKQLANNFDLFINEAFSVCHRDQSSVTGVAGFLPSYAGFRLQEEVEVLEKAKSNPEHPAVAIIGGSKIETKLPLIKKFEEIYEFVLVGGKVANEALDQEIKFSEKVKLPVDFSGNRLDIGPETIEEFKDIIIKCKTVVWNGPLGKFEEAPYDKGTFEILEAIAGSDAFSLTGGGESVEVLEKNGLLDKFDFVSTGGGAMLEFMSGEELPGIKALE